MGLCGNIYGWYRLSACVAHARGRLTGTTVRFTTHTETPRFLVSCVGRRGGALFDGLIYFQNVWVLYVSVCKKTKRL